MLAIAVKPQDAAALLDELGPKVPADKLVISLCAGLPTSFFARRLPDGTPVVRVMTNTPALVDEAMTAISAGAHATDEHLALAEEMFRPLGRDDPGARVAAGRGDRAVRLRPGVLLLPGRGDDRRRASCSACPARSRTT